MVARRMAEERLFAVITSNSSHSVQKSCCVIATSSSTMRTLGFVIIFFPVTNQNRAGGALHLHLCSIPFRRMPRIRELHTRFYGNARASVGARRRTRISRENAAATTSTRRGVCTVVDSARGRGVNNCEQAPSWKAKVKRQKAKE